MTLTKEQFEKLKPWMEMTPERLAEILTAELASAMEKPEVQEQMAAAVIPALEPLGEEFEKLEQRIEKLEAALFRRTSV